LLSKNRCKFSNLFDLYKYKIGFKLEFNYLTGVLLADGKNTSVKLRLYRIDKKLILITESRHHFHLPYNYQVFVQIDTKCLRTQGGNFLEIPIPQDISSHSVFYFRLLYECQRYDYLWRLKNFQ